MIDPANLVIGGAILVGLTAVEAVFLLMFLALVQNPSPVPSDAVEKLDVPAGPSPPSFRPSPGTPGSFRSVGYIPQFGIPLGWGIAFGVLLALTVVSVFPGGFLVAAIGWWVAALKLFGLTVRQTLKANIALGLLNIVILMSIGLVASG